MKVTLQVNGREMTFSEQELIAILEEHFSSKITKQTTTVEAVQKPTEQVTTVKVVQKPTEGEWFDVRPQTIDQKLFEEEREDESQEATRQSILIAFTAMKKNPEEYGKNFKTMFPALYYNGSINLVDFEWKAKSLGDHLADMVEQALEWAQRIANGESWESLCNDADTANCYRVVNRYERYDSGLKELIGGSVLDRNIKKFNYTQSATMMRSVSVRYTKLINSVPLVVRYE